MCLLYEFAMKENMKFISLLKNKRLDRRLTLEELSERSDISASYLSEIENGYKETCPDETLLKIAQALDIDIDAVMVNIGRLPDSFFFARKDKPEELTKALKKLLKTFEKKYYDKG